MAPQVQTFVHISTCLKNLRVILRVNFIKNLLSIRTLLFLTVLHFSIRIVRNLANTF